MSQYCPFLLPLLEADPYPATGPQVRSPLDEEKQIERLPNKPAGLWKSLQIRVALEYGLPLLSATPDSTGTAQRLPGTGPGGVPGCLVVPINGHCWFLLEHPDRLPLYDQLGQASHRVALARPSLFTRLWRESDPLARPAETVAEEIPQEFGGIALGDHLQALMAQDKPSDWHLEPDRQGYRSRLRIDGILSRIQRLSRSKGEWLIQTITARAGLEITRRSFPVEGRLELGLPDNQRVNMRLSLIPSLYGLSLVARFFYPETRQQDKLDDLGMPAEQAGRLQNRYLENEGLWLVVGPTGSGKSTTLQTLLRRSVSRREKILAVEDPVELIVDGVQHVSLDKARGFTYSRAIRAFLRQAPDTILVGEIRDEETAAVAIQASRTGHRVLSTVHARSHEGVCRRMEDLGQSRQAVLQVARIILHQRLLPRLCQNCQSRQPVPISWKAALHAAGLDVPDFVPSSQQCQLCENGCRGRIALFSSGLVPPPESVETELLRAGWMAVQQGQISLESCHPFFSALSDEGFQLCQG